MSAVVLPAASADFTSTQVIFSNSTRSDCARGALLADSAASIREAGPPVYARSSWARALSESEVTITATNVETRMRSPRFMRRKLERIEVANLDFIRFFSSCRPCRPHRHPKANTFLAMPHRAETVEADPSLWRTAQKSPSAFPSSKVRRNHQA